VGLEWEPIRRPMKYSNFHHRQPRLNERSIIHQSPIIRSTDSADCIPPIRFQWKQQRHLTPPGAKQQLAPQRHFPPRSSGAEASDDPWNMQMSTYLMMSGGCRRPAGNRTAADCTRAPSFDPTGRWPNQIETAAIRMQLIRQLSDSNPLESKGAQWERRMLHT